MDSSSITYIECSSKTQQESDRVVTKKEGINFAREYGCLFIECGAKARVNVQQYFEELVLKGHLAATLKRKFLSTGRDMEYDASTYECPYLWGKSVKINLL
ncbi:hypothetical protein ACOSQ4_027015 [Xanthoceras sorbifolium]